MKKFKFTPKKSKEAIGVCDAQNQEEAAKQFAKTKKLSLEAFLGIYEVKEVGK